MRKKYGEQFRKIIVDPRGDTDLLVVPNEIVNELKELLSENFHSFLFSKIRKSINQAARDARKKKVLSRPSDVTPSGDENI